MKTITFMTLAAARLHNVDAFDKAVYAAVAQGIDLVGARALAESLHRPMPIEGPVKVAKAA